MIIASAPAFITYYPVRDLSPPLKPPQNFHQVVVPSVTPPKVVIVTESSFSVFKYHPQALLVFE